MRTPVFAANWKMHKTVHDAVAFVREFGAFARDVDRADMILAPPFTALAAAADAARDMNVSIAAQDLYFEREGAFTGEISALMIRDAGATHVIVGHSERRRLFGDTDDWVNRKTRAAFASELTPIVCIGETLAEREANQTLDVLDRQIRAGLDTLTGDQIATLLVAYEPVWAIGTGLTPTNDDILAMHAHIRQELSRRFNDAAAIRILYGGSVKPDNAAEIFKVEGVNGALVGGASLKAKDFLAIVAGIPATA